MATSLLRTVLPVDDWILLPTPDYPHSREAVQRRRAYGRFVRHLFFDIGRGSFMQLSPEDHKIVLDYCRSQYESYKQKCASERRKPMAFNHTRCGYVRFWKRFQRSIYVQRDIPKKIKEFEQSERVTEVPEFHEVAGM